eukprot:8475439-Alexandrium_andersonii.AAC.1
MVAQKFVRTWVDPSGARHKCQYLSGHLTAVECCVQLRRTPPSGHLKQFRAASRSSKRLPGVTGERPRQPDAD